MKTSTLIRYQWNDSKNSIFIFYLIVIAALIFLGATTGATLTINGVNLGGTTASGEPMHGISGMETATAIFLLVVGICTFGEYFQMFLQNGVTRRQTLRSMVLFQLVLAGGMAVVDSIVSIIIKLLTTQFTNIAFIDIFSLLYDNHTAELPSILVFFEKLVFLFLLYSLVTAAGHLIAIFYYRASKAWLIGVSVGVPVFFILILPLIDLFIYPVSNYIIDFFRYLFSGANTGSPYLIMLFFVLSTLLITFFRYLFIRRICKRKP